MIKSEDGKYIVNLDLINNTIDYVHTEILNFWFTYSNPDI